MKKTRITIVALAAVFTANTSFSQDWVKKMNDPTANFYEIQNDFNAYWQGKTIEKGKGWKPFKRWEWFWEPRVFPTGNFPSNDIAWNEYYKYQATHQIAAKTNTSKAANWTLIGPSSWTMGPSSYSPGIGRINCIAVDPTNSNIIYVGAPAGGLWKTTDGGLTWITTTDGLPVIGVSSIVIDPSNTSTLWMTTGDADNNDTYSVGILKSTDGGTTWNTTGFSLTVDNGWRIYKLIMNPSNPQSQLIVSNGGIYQTYDGWSSYNFIQSGIYKDIEYKPGDTTVVYACGDAFHKSTNGGVSFTQITSGLPLSGIRRMAIAVTDANSAYVYIVACNDTNYALDGVYRSTDSGNNFAQQSGTSPNLLGYATDGSDAGGQGWYDLAIAISPSNASEVFIGGVNVWKSTDGGANWAINCHWVYQTNPNAYVHADIHALEYIGTTLYCGSDGGFFKTINSGTLWTDLSAGLEITQYYRMGGYPSDANYIFAGSQDNGVSKFSAGTHYSVWGGDGMHCIIDPSNFNTVYVENQNGSIRKSTDGGDNFSFLVNPANLGESGAWISPLAMDPVNAQILYVAYQNVHKSTDGGAFWTAISNLGLSAALRYMAIAPSNSNYIYTSTYDTLYMTNDGGTNWFNITSTLPVASASISNIAVDPVNPSKVYVTFSGYVAGEKVYVSTNAGTSWINISGTLANLPVVCVKPHTSSNNDVYVGTDVGIYLRNDSIGDWIDYSTGLPNTPVFDLNIHSGTSQLRAATRGRGIWTSDLFSVSGGGGQVSYGTQIGCTYYDLQTNSAVRNGLVRKSDGTMAAVWIQNHSGLGFDPADRGIGYNYYDGTQWVYLDSLPATPCQQGECGMPHGCASEFVGWPNIVWSDSIDEIVIAHAPLKTTSRPTQGSGAWSGTNLVPIASFPYGGDVWPRAVADGKYIHIIASSPAGVSPNGVERPVVYFRSSDGGATWDIQNFLIPGMDDTLLMFDGSGADAYAIDARNGKVAITAGGQGSHWLMWKSNNNGDTNSWVRDTIAIFDTTGVTIWKTDSSGQGSTWTFDDAHSVVVDNNGLVHAAAGHWVTVVDSMGKTTGFFNPMADNGLSYWNENMEAPLTVGGLVDLPNISGAPPDGIPNSGIGNDFPTYFTGITSAPQVSVDLNGNPYIVYSALVEWTSNTGDITGQSFRDLYLVYSPDGGNTWNKPINIAGKIAGVDDGSSGTGLAEDVFPMTHKIIYADNLLNVVWQVDNEPGTAVQEGDPVVLNSIMHYSFNVNTDLPPFERGVPNAIIIDTATCGNANGSILVGSVINTLGVLGTHFGPLTYSIDSGANFQSDPFFDSLSAGIYSIIVKDLTNAIITISVSVIDAGAPQLDSIVSTPESFVGANDGTASVYVSGGTPPYTILWSTGDSVTGVTTSTISGLAAGQYSVEVSDAAGCISAGVVTVAGNIPLSKDAGIISIDAPISGCGLSATENVTVKVKNLGTDSISSIPVAYRINGAGAIFDTIFSTILPGDTLTFTFTSTANLSATGTVVFDAWTNLATDVFNFNDSITNYSIDNLTVAVVDLGNDTAVCGNLLLDAKNPGYSYSWSTGDTTQTIIVAVSNTYFVGVTTPGCSTVFDTISVTVNSSPVVNLGSDTNVCISHNLDAGNPGSTFSWSSSETTQIITVSSSGIYWVDVINANGCTTRDSISITINSAPIANITPGGSTVICSGDSVVLVSDTATTYNWLLNGISSGLTNINVIVNTSGDYQVVVTNVFGCEDTSATETVTVYNDVTGTVFTTDETVSGANDGTAWIVISGGTPPYSISWLPGGDTSDTITNLSPGTYFVTVTDSNDCTFTGSDSVAAGAVRITSLLYNAGSIKLYPNPTTGMLNVDIDAELEVTVITIYNIIGIMISKHENITYQSNANSVNNYHYEIDLSGEPAGSYFVIIQTSDWVIIRIVYLNK